MTKKSEETLASEAKILDLRRAGLSFEAIAVEVALPKTTVRRYYRNAMARTDSPDVAEARNAEVDRLDRLLVAVWPRALRGDLAAVDRVLKISERRAKLLGLDHAAEPAPEGGAPSAGSSPLDELRKRRQNRATAVDQASS